MAPRPRLLRQRAVLAAGGRPRPSRQPNCLPAGETFDPVYLVVYQPLRLGASYSLDHAESVGSVPCQGKLACSISSNFNMGIRMAGVSSQQILQWAPTFISGEGARCSSKVLGGRAALPLGKES